MPRFLNAAAIVLVAGFLAIPIVGLLAGRFHPGGCVSACPEPATSATPACADFKSGKGNGNTHATRTPAFGDKADDAGEKAGSDRHKPKHPVPAETQPVLQPSTPAGIGTGLDCPARAAATAADPANPDAGERSDAKFRNPIPEGTIQADSPGAGRGHAPAA